MKKLCPLKGGGQWEEGQDEMRLAYLKERRIR